MKYKKGDTVILTNDIHIFKKGEEGELIKGHIDKNGIAWQVLIDNNLKWVNINDFKLKDYNITIPGRLKEEFKNIIEWFFAVALFIPETEKQKELFEILEGICED